MLFKSDSSKQAQEIVFPRKKSATNQGAFSKTFLTWNYFFLEHINKEIKKANKGITVIKILSLSLPRSSLITIYRSFIYET